MDFDTKMRHTWTTNSSWDELFLRRHRARTTKYNKLAHKFRHRQAYHSVCCKP